MDQALVSALQARRKEAERRERNPRFKDSFGPFLSAIENRRRNKTNSNVAVTGEPGLGKSTLSLVCGEKLRPEVFVDHPEEAVAQFVTFRTSTFIRAIKDCPKGSVIIGDEFGQQMHHRTFMKEGNISLSNVLQGFRYKEHIAFMNVPALALIDTDAQRLLTWMAYVDKRGRATIYRVTHPTFNGTDFFHTFVDDLRFPQPRDALWKAYLAAKFENQEKVMEDSIRIAEKVETVPFDDEDVIKAINEDRAKWQKTRKSGEVIYDAPAIERHFKVGRNRVYRILRGLDDPHTENPS